MSTNARRLRHAEQVREGRLHKKEMLAYLKSRASVKNATKRDIIAYKEALKDRECYLKRERERKKQSRKKLKESALSKEEHALAIVARIKEQKHKQYMKHKVLGKCKEWEKKSAVKNFGNSLKKSSKMKRSLSTKPRLCGTTKK